MGTILEPFGLVGLPFSLMTSLDVQRDREFADSGDVSSYFLGLARSSSVRLTRLKGGTWQLSASTAGLTIVFSPGDLVPLPTPLGVEACFTLACSSRYFLAASLCFLAASCFSDIVAEVFLTTLFEVDCVTVMPCGTFDAIVWRLDF